MKTEPNKAPSVTTWFNSRLIPRSRVRTWEERRLSKALKHFGVPAVSGGIEEQRAALVQAKIDAGRGEIERRFAREIAMSDAVTRVVARASGKRRRLSQVELLATGCPTAQQWVDWYTARFEADDETVLLQACPDHHLFRPVDSGQRLEVWETAGGSPLASRFFFTLDEEQHLTTPADPTYPVQMTGTGRLADGTIIGGIRHQFRDEDAGLRVLLTVEMPWLMGPIGPAAHRWHLATEFCNWLLAPAPNSN